MEELQQKLESHYSVVNTIKHWLMGLGMGETLAEILKVGIAVVIMLLLSLSAYFIVRYIFVRLVLKLSKRTNSTWGQVFAEHKFFHRFAHIAPAIIIYLSIDVVLGGVFPSITEIIRVLCKIYMVVVVLMMLNAFLDSVNDLYRRLPFSSNWPITGLLQVVRIALVLVGGIGVVSILLKKDPSTLIVGLGASTAVLMLVFKDTISGLVASVQLTANNMLKIGDWITLPSRNLDGTVLDIGLTTVKVQNWDNSITTVPPFALVCESFVNWRGMTDGDGRRIKKAVLIDLKTVHFCTTDMLNRYAQIGLVAGYVAQLRAQLSAQSGAMPTGAQATATNLNIFRHYMLAYLKQHPSINQQSTLMVRLLQPDQYGIPLEVYCFSSIKAWVEYEGVQSDIMDHMVAASNAFDLKLFQRSSSSIDNPPPCNP
ncbi:MAG: mechanosensitive ion channel [Bacteroidales bacterium]|nr:mechanosensitive ion channel [Bacteroidales bacterium]